MCKNLMHFELAPVFTDGMVLQRNSDVSIWGTAPSGETVTVVFCDQKESTVAENNHWRLSIAPLAAGGPFEMSISTTESTIVLTDILVGDVWIAGGQSNMEYRLRDSLTADVDVPQALFENIRSYKVPQTYSFEMPAEREVWQHCTPENAPLFSAVAYYFAKDVHNKLQVPIGIVECNLGGTSASCWMSEEDIKNDEELKVYWDEYCERVSQIPVDELERKTTEYRAKVSEFKRLEKIERSKGKTQKEIIEKIGDYPWPPPEGPQAPLRPCGLYYTMFKELAPFTCKGVIWYQGESDRVHPYMYGKLLTTLINRWRVDFENQSLPFLIVQLPEYEQPGDTYEHAWSILREEQFRVSSTLPNVSLTISFGYGEKNDIHPKYKRPIGQALALAGLNTVYGYTDIEYSGPIFERAQLHDGKILISYTHVGEGLCIGNKNTVNDSRYNPNELIGFEVGNANGEFTPATASISGDCVEILPLSDTVSVRYGWGNYTECNLCNKNGLPSAPFGAKQL